MKIRLYTWEEFDEAVARIERPICDSLCPIPRGGLILAVALSHKFGIKIVDRPTRKSVFVDDIADSGNTIISWKLRYGNCPSVVLLRRSSCNPIGIQAAEVIESDEWIVFPWENKEKAQEDYEAYIARK
ncbi:Phosphoribosyltransferase domain [uncultured Caudovirales phage]|uniref:Phosphoribosyltransferase domain n=1 Tax=uncultured Caudovirales phage TaxID=2100421 RepID=A0A6J5SY63_9CAUD|nr:Phosphoribosyltransferase domain [uncultured Caudovirales phage]CAB4219327.1 Phosphoribosyltransferase domain [uncultured Caudovirales phage]